MPIYMLMRPGSGVAGQRSCTPFVAIAFSESKNRFAEHCVHKVHVYGSPTGFTHTDFCEVCPIILT